MLCTLLACASQSELSSGSTQCEQNRVDKERATLTKFQEQARAQTRLAIEDSLAAGLPRSYSPEFYKEKCSAVFEHVFEAFGGERSQVA